MKKLFLLGIVGSMLVAGQSLVFAESTNQIQAMKLTKATATVENTGKQKTVQGVGEAIFATMISGVAKEMPITEEKAVKIAEVLGLDAKELQKQTMSQVLDGLAEAQFNKLVDEGIIEVKQATMVSEAAKEIFIAEEKVVEIAKVLGLDAKELQKQTMGQVLDSLTEAQFNKLVDEGVIMVMPGANMTASIEVSEAK